MLRRLNEELIKSFEQKEEEEANSIKLEMTPEGLRITVFDRTKRPVFKSQSSELTPYGDWVFSTLAWQISRYAQFSVELEGHTESGTIPVRAEYGEWELSSDRANTTRRKLVHDGVSTGQIRKVAGYGDTIPMPETQPEDEVNRRVTVMLKIHSGRNG